MTSRTSLRDRAGVALIFALFVAPARAATPPPPPDVSVTSLGMQTWTDSSLGGLQDTDPQVPQPTDADLQLSQRLRWTLAGDRSEPGLSVVALADARFTVDPGGPDGTPPFEWSQVRQLGAEFASGKWTLDLGRHPIFRGGPRLVDGVQALLAPSDAVRIGLWGGLVPNLFTTVPELRPGGGPILSYGTSNIQLSVVGDVSVYDGALDRVGFLSLGRYALERRLEASTRLDVEIIGQQDTPRLVDGQLVVIGTPVPAFRLEALYDAFSAYTYLGSEANDKDLDRFAQRLGAIGLAELIVQNIRDPSLNHLVGATARLQPETDGLVPKAQLTLRQRFGDDPVDTYTRINPQAGVLQVGEVLDIIADGNVILAKDLDAAGGLVSTTQLDAGLLLYLAPGDGTVAFDASVRGISAPAALSGPGLYTDLFVDVVSVPLDLLFTAGGMVTSEADLLDGQDSLGLGAFVRMSKYLRPSR